MHSVLICCVVVFLPGFGTFDLWACFGCFDRFLVTASVNTFKSWTPGYK